MKLCENDKCLKYTDNYFENRYGYDIICYECYYKISEKYKLNALRLLMELCLTHISAKRLVEHFLKKYKGQVIKYNHMEKNSFSPYDSIKLLEFSITNRFSEKQRNRFRTRIAELQVYCSDKNNFDL